MQYSQWRQRIYGKDRRDIGAEKLYFNTITNISFDIPDTNTFKYVADGGSEWIDVTFGTNISFTQYVAFSGTTSGFSKASGTNYYKFTATDKVKVTGSVSSLINGSTSVSNYKFANLFSGCSNLVDASELELPASSVAQGGYQTMFAYCTSLTAAP